MAKKNEPSNALLKGFDDYQKTDLDKIWSSMRLFYQDNRKFCIENNIPDEVYSIIARKGVINKLNLSYCMACIFVSEAVFKAYLKTLHKDVQAVFEILLWQPSITEIEASTILEHNIFDLEKRTYGNYVDKKLHAGFYFFAVKQLTNYGHESQDWFRLSLPKGVQDTARAYYPKPIDFTLNPVAKPEATGYVFEAESIIFQELPKLIAYYLQDNLKFSQRHKPMIPSVKKMGKSLSIKEFYKGDDTLENLRAYLLAAFLGDLDIKKMATEPLRVLPFLLKQHYGTKSFSFAEMLLTDIKGFGYLYYGFRDIGDNILYILLNLPIGEWISIENIKKYVGIHNVNLLPLSEHDLGDKIYYESQDPEDSARGSKDRYYASKDTDDLIAYPILNGTFFLFAAYGFLEIAYDPINTNIMGQTYNSVYDGLKYVKLTKLGAYVLGLTKKYEIENALADSSLIFSEDSLIILADGDLSVNEILLKNFTERVSGNRFRVSYDTFLKDCKTRKELKSKIEGFRQTVNKKLPNNWERFLEELTLKSKAIETSADVTVLKLPETDRHLHSLIAQDAALKSLVAKAEGFQIIVTKDNLPKLKSRLKDYGYLLD